MYIKQTKSGYEYSYICKHCGSHITIYPADCLKAEYSYTEEKQNRKIKLRCPVCDSSFEIETKDLPFLFRTVISRKRGWKLKGG